MLLISVRNKFTSLALAISVLLSLSACAPLVIVGGVGVGAAVATDRRDGAVIIEDLGIELRATDTIYSDEELGKKVQVNVHSYNGVVLLVGTVPNKEMRDKVGTIVDRMKPVRKVYNELRISDRTALENRSNDAWLSAKVKKQLVEEFGLITHTLVVTSNEVVYLMGLVNAEEADKAHRAAAQLRGVKDVILLYERNDVAENDADRFSIASPIKPEMEEQRQKELDRQEQQEDQDTELLPFELAPAATIPEKETP